MITLYGAVRTDTERTELQGDGDTYEAARADLLAQVPDGLQLLGISQWSCMGDG